MENCIAPFSSRLWLASPTMHGDELKYMQEAYETNWMSTVGANINAVEHQACEQVGCRYAVAFSAGTAAKSLPSEWSTRANSLSAKGENTLTTASTHPSARGRE